MTDIQVQPADNLHETVADTRRTTGGPDGGYVPYGLAGYTHNGECYCPDCADEQTVTSPDGSKDIPMTEYPAFEADPNGFGVGIIDGMSEWDYPGAVCGVCHTPLDTQVLVYREGPGSEHYVE